VCGARRGGSGTAGATGSVACYRRAALGRPLRYLYTDLSKAFTDHGRTRFAAAYPFLEFAELDVDRDDGIAAVPEGSADAVIASNVLHATRDIRRTLDRVRRLLKPGGVLILNEGCRIRDFATLTFGLTGGWWAFDDPAERIPHTPLLDEAGWRRILDGQGFSGVRCFDLPDGKPGRGTQIVLLASRDAASQPAGAVPPPATVVVARAADAAVPGTGGETDGAGLPGRVTDYVRGVLGEVLKIDPAQIRANQTFEVHGVDSLVALTINGRFEQDLGPVPATLLFEHPTAAKLADHLLATHGETLARLLSPPAAPAPAPVEPLPAVVSASPAPISPTSIPPAPAAPSSVAPSSVALAQAARSNQPRRRPDERSRSAMRARVENLPDDKVEQLLRQMLGRRSLR
ncbi:methyltransferase, partial [Azospirillum brasilense]|uniref:methyltransferase n=1 Tax=Azospirillum argentinense TaxID=2970906 RepID=UPI00190EC085